MEFDEKAVAIREELEKLNRFSSEFPQIDPSHFKLIVVSTIIKKHDSERQFSVDSSKSERIISLLDSLTYNKYDSRRLSEVSLKRIYNRVSETIKNIDHDLSIQMGTQLIDEVIGALIGVSESHPPIVSAIVGSIQATLGNTQLYELQTITGHISLGKYDSSRYGSFPMLYQNSDAHRDLVSAKLLLNDITPNFIRWEELGKYEYGNESTYVIDCPAQSISNLNKDLTIPNPEIAIGNLAASGISGRVMVVMTSSKGSKANHATSILASAGREYSIEALIDFTSFSASKKPTEYSLIILGNHGPTHEAGHGILTIDVTRNNKLVEHLDLVERALLAGHIYNIWQGRDPDYETNSVSARVKRILRAQFYRGYEDVRNLCFVKKIDQSFGLKNLTARGHFLRDDGRGDLANFLVDSDPIITPLLEFQKPSCTYVIGNNGQGKSLLLRDLAFKLAAFRKKSVGISLSISDRFPFQSSQLKPYFKYDGARTAEDTLSLKRRSQGITKTLALIFKGQTHLDLFSQCLGALNFEPRYYFVRRNIRSLESSISGENNYIRLSHFADTNEVPSQLSKYEFAIVRSDGEERITPFSNLSSGEQNIILLLIKLIESARNGRTILLDEPEISLHVKWQQALPKILESICDTYESSIVVATHSPILIANAGMDSFCYQASEGALLPIPISERSSVETILLDGFKTYTPHNREVHEKCARLVAEIIELKNTTPEDKINTNAIERLDALYDLLKSSTATADPERLKVDLDLILKAKIAITTILEQELTTYA